MGDYAEKGGKKYHRVQPEKRGAVKAGKKTTGAKKKSGIGRTRASRNLCGANDTNLLKAKRTELLKLLQTRLLLKLSAAALEAGRGLRNLHELATNEHAEIRLPAIVNLWTILSRAVYNFGLLPQSKELFEFAGRRESWPILYQARNGEREKVQQRIDLLRLGSETGLQLDRKGKIASLETPANSIVKKLHFCIEQCRNNPRENILFIPSQQFLNLSVRKKINPDEERERRKLQREQVRRQRKFNDWIRRSAFPPPENSKLTGDITRTTTA